MTFAGVDVGAETIKLVILNEGEILFSKVLATEEEGAVASQQLMEEALKETNLSLDELSYVISTGSGRATVPFANKKRSEQLCHARGAHWLIPSAQTILDVGAEGSRAMKLNDEGKVIDFAINSKCASGTGTLLRSMTKIVEMPIEEMGIMAANAKSAAKVSSFCAVFAESEVISSIHTGVPEESIVAGIHESVVSRLLEVLRRVGLVEDVVVTGGVANNIGIIKRLEPKIGLEIKVPQNPQTMGALGAALMAQEMGDES
jgi:predicted CoA-substrate-specific enzyme activase